MYMGAPPKTRASVVITLAAKLGVFNIPAVSELTRTDELELDKMGDRKQALFCVIPQAETTYNFLVGLVYTSLFSALYKRGEEMPAERDDGKNFLKVPVQVLMDEFANGAMCALISTQMDIDNYNKTYQKGQADISTGEMRETKAPALKLRRAAVMQTAGCSRARERRRKSAAAAFC